MTRHDVAIYRPEAAVFYERNQARTGGAERQMLLLACTLAERGLRVAHIVHPVGDPIPGLSPQLTLLHRKPYSGRRSLGWLREAVHVLSALWHADAEVGIVRTGTPVVGVASFYSRLRRRKLIFSSASDLDFTLEMLSDRRWRRTVYGLGVRLADLVVVQTDEQARLARQTFPRLKHVVRIPSFAMPQQPGQAETLRPDAFLWMGRIVDYKDPLAFVELARSVPDARFVMIGIRMSAHGQLFAEVEAAAAALPNLELREPVVHAEALEHVARAVAVVNTSPLEGMPNVFLEAWSHGVPVLSLHFDPDAIVRRMDLGVSAQGSWDEFVAGARHLWESREDRADLARRAREYVAEVHSPESVGARWQAVIDDVTRRPRTPAASG